ncbi:hypothetical protein D3C87_2112330 [compost metagenome]
MNSIENTVKFDFLAVYGYREIVSVNWKFSFVFVYINPFFFENMNSESVVFCFVKVLFYYVSAD